MGGMGALRLGQPTTGHLCGEQLCPSGEHLERLCESHELLLVEVLRERAHHRFQDRTAAGCCLSPLLGENDLDFTAILLGRTAGDEARSLEAVDEP